MESTATATDQDQYDEMARITMSLQSIGLGRSSEIKNELSARRSAMRI